MPKFIVTVWETREYTVPVEADDEYDAKEVAQDVYAEESVEDSFVSTEVRDVTPVTPDKSAV